MQMKFKDVIDKYLSDLKNEMSWNNYNLNDTELEVQEILKDHALLTLKRAYGSSYFDDIEDDIENLKNEIFINFPSLLQQLSVSRVINGRAVVPVDTLSEIITRREDFNKNVSGLGTLTVGTTTEQNTTSSATGSNTGIVEDTGTTTDVQGSSLSNTSISEIENSSNAEITGGRTTSVSYALPHQALQGITQGFPVDEEGNPILSDATVDNANAVFNTSNPMTTTDESSQTTTNSSESSLNNTTTNNLKTDSLNTSNESATGSMTLSNSGQDISDTTQDETGYNEVREQIDREATNAQYSYEINAFLQSSMTYNAYKTWVKEFSWIRGII